VRLRERAGVIEGDREREIEVKRGAVNVADGWPDLQRLEAAILASNGVVVAAGSSSNGAGNGGWK